MVFDLRGLIIARHSLIDRHNVLIKISLNVDVAVLVARDPVNLAVTIRAHRTGQRVRLAAAKTARDGQRRLGCRQVLALASAELHFEVLDRPGRHGRAGGSRRSHADGHQLRKLDEDDCK